MLRILEPGASHVREIDRGQAIPSGSIWIDMLSPGDEEEARVEALLGHDIPTREEMEEIEASSRLYRDGGATFMTATVLAVAGHDMPLGGPVTFILTGSRLVTVRYHEPRPFETYAASLAHKGAPRTGAGVLVALLEVIVDRLADILEEAGGVLDEVSTRLFSQQEGARTGELSETYDAILRQIGRSNSRVATAQESLMGLNRMLGYVRLPENAGIDPDDVETLRQDLKSLIDHNAYLHGKVAFLLDATMGLINIEQNSIIKIFSVMAVIFLPPTLVASIYGMNFEVMPELDWQYGYPLALGLMVLFAIGPYWFFKKMKWL